MRPRAVRSACLAISAALHVAGLAWLAAPVRSTPPRPARPVIVVATLVTPAQAGAHEHRGLVSMDRTSRAPLAARVGPGLSRGDGPPRSTTVSSAPSAPAISGVAFAPPTFPGALSRRADPPPFDVAAAHAASQARQQSAAFAALAMAALQAQVQQWTPGPQAASACALPGEGDAPPDCDGVPPQDWQRLVTAVQAFYRQVPQLRLQLAVGEEGYRLLSAPGPADPGGPP